jgi:MHS family proline/betaine transporter-like MFS transporter
MSQMKKVVASTMLGNGLEWYDYALYGTFTALISKHFFPAGDDAVALIATFGIFAIGFLMRPLGAMMFGYIGDKYGRKNALSLSILMMAIPTACIGLLPTYSMIGIYAPILLTLIRLVQGVAIGGEFGGSIVYLVEHAKPANKNRVGSLSMISMLIGLFFGTMISALLAKFMSPEDFDTFGWRIPFILGFFIGLVGLYIRTKLNESPVFIEAQEAGHVSESPISETFKNNYKEVLLGVGLYLAVTIPFYIQTVFMPSFMVKFMHFSSADALTIYLIVLGVMMICAPISAFWCDTKNRERLMKIVTVGYLLFAIPYVYLLDYQTFTFALISQMVFASIIAFYIAPIPTLVTELFPARTRYTGMSLSCNLAAAIFGGTSPMLITALITGTGSNYPIAIYVMIAAFVSMLCVWEVKRRRDSNRLYLIAGAKHD